MSNLLKEKIVFAKKLADDIIELKINSEIIAQNAKPGQFVNVRCSDSFEPLLRRPISICDVDKANNTITIVYQVKGIGTSSLSKLGCDGTIDIIGPLGKGFLINREYKNIVVIGGGIGVFPLLYLLKEYEGISKNAYLGFRNSKYVVLEEEFKRNCDELNISTDDGSYGLEGLVTSKFEKDLETKTPDIIFACGPTPMLKSIVQIANNHNIKCQVSIEQRMGCGIGACLVCACKTKTEDGFKYSHVCKDGPVFWSNELILDY